VGKVIRAKTSPVPAKEAGAVNAAAKFDPSKPLANVRRERFC
jgi:hypothetical protein